MSSTLVVVTCIKDNWSFEMLCKSIKKYLSSCNIIIIYNDKEENFNAWKIFYNKLHTRYFQNHNVLLQTQRDYWTLDDESHLHPMQKEGWVDQQVLKLSVSENVNTKSYTCIDSKNFFIKPLQVEDIAQIQPEPITWTDEILENWVKFCCKTLELNYPGKQIKLTQNTTPYKIDTEEAKKLVEHFGGIKKFYRWFTKNAIPDSISPSEFFLYELWLKKQGISYKYEYKLQNSVSMWGFQIEELKWNLADYVNYFLSNIERYDTRVAGIHKTVKELYKEEQIKYILSATNNLDLLPTLSKY
jgi:hypothetical protein